MGMIEIGSAMGTMTSSGIAARKWRAIAFHPARLRSSRSETILFSHRTCPSDWTGYAT